MGYFAVGANWHRRLDYNYILLAIIHCLCYLVHRFLYIASVSPSIMQAWRAYGDKNDICIGRYFLESILEGHSMPGSLHHGSKPHLFDWTYPLPKHGNLRMVLVHADDLMTKIGQGGSSSKTYISCTYHH